MLLSFSNMMVMMLVVLVVEIQCVAVLFEHDGHDAGHDGGVGATVVVPELLNALQRLAAMMSEVTFKETCCKTQLLLQPLTVYSPNSNQKIPRNQNEPTSIVSARQAS